MARPSSHHNIGCAGVPLGISTTAAATRTVRGPQLAWDHQITRAVQPTGPRTRKAPWTSMGSSSPSRRGTTNCLRSFSHWRRRMPTLQHVIGITGTLAKAGGRFGRRFRVHVERINAAPVFRLRRAFAEHLAVVVEDLLFRHGLADQVTFDVDGNAVGQ